MSKQEVANTWPFGRIRPGGGLNTPLALKAAESAALVGDAETAVADSTCALDGEWSVTGWKGVRLLTGKPLSGPVVTFTCTQGPFVSERAPHLRFFCNSEKQEET